MSCPSAVSGMSKVRPWPRSANSRRSITENWAPLSIRAVTSRPAIRTRAVPDNVGRTLIEIYSGPEFIARAVSHPLTGPGVAALEQAHRDGRPVIVAAPLRTSRRAATIATKANRYLTAYPSDAAALARFVVRCR